MKAACAALTTEVRNGDAKVACDKFNKGHCAPGSKGDRECGSAAFQDKNQGICKETDDGYEYAPLLFYFFKIPRFLVYMCCCCFDGFLVLWCCGDSIYLEC